MKKENNSKDSSQPTVLMPKINAFAAGIDVGSKFHVVAVGQDKEKEVRTFGVTTPDLHEMAKFLRSHNIDKVAMESTGYYWIPLYWMLVSYDFQVMVINPTAIKCFNRPKTDILDAMWIQQLHTLNLLKASFQLDNFGESFRAYTRRRATLIRDRNRIVNRMHKTLILMNIQIGTQLTDLDGKSGLLVIEAIVGGQRDPKVLLGLIHKSVKTSREELRKALEGTWQPHYLFELKQLFSSYLAMNVQVKECDSHIENELEMYCTANNIATPDRGLKPENYKERQVVKDKNGTTLHVVRILQSVAGIDLLSVGGVGSGLILNAAAELGFSLEQFPTPKHFTSWLGLAPNNKITGGKVISTHTPNKINPAARAFRGAANSIGNAKEHAFKPFFMSILRKHGRKGAIVATARKLAIAYYHMVKDKAPFSYEKSAEQIKKQKDAAVRKIQKMVAALNIQPQDIQFAS